MAFNMRKIKVLQFICPAGFYGAEMWVIALAKELDRSLIDCSLAITKESETQDMSFYGKFCSLGLPSYLVQMSSRFDIRGLMRLKRLVVEQDIHIIHTHGYKSDILGLIVAKLTGVKCVSTPHGFENSANFKLSLFIWLGCKSLKYFDFVVPLSEELALDMERLGVAKERIRLIKNGVDLSEIKKIDEFTKNINLFEGKEKVIGYVGQLIKRKNIDALLNAFELLYQETKNVRLVIIGDGARRPYLEEEARKLKSSKNIEFLGYRKDRLELMHQMDIFCMTSSLEGIPRCMMEAMACGTPVTAFNIPGVDQLIENGISGLLAEYDDINALKNSWQKLLSDSNYAQQIALNGKKRVKSHFSAQRMASEYVSLYKEIA